MRDAAYYAHEVKAAEAKLAALEPAHRATHPGSVRARRSALEARLIYLRAELSTALVREHAGAVEQGRATGDNNPKPTTHATA